ncbi:uncharacterized protein BJX67DRAFT_321031 [Aspergillus lucknowensis]|uniref:Uncharacterized protein n=1 Tax=Aspergillus lucknowensis TaxID=176173 RepID=A0ABR4LZ11_9EURO
MRYISDQTSVPVPFILHWGTREESQLNLSPFIMISHIEHKTTMYNALNTPGCPNKERGVLDPSINKEKLGMLYAQLARVLL